MNANLHKKDKSPKKKGDYFNDNVNVNDNRRFSEATEIQTSTLTGTIIKVIGYWL